ncbi:MAG: hypothetical protein EXR65_04590 [Dehalococcoidia bacterium]|nr:hypothetical protein [Dehalococcoidia bacterium]
MPSLGSHLATARLLAQRLRRPAIDAERGSFYLGATAPDIRALTRLDRGRYHFFDLDDFAHQDSIALLFERHPALRAAARLDAPTRAFMAGYLTHLVMDEQYIVCIYRERFGTSIWGEDPRGNLLDRVLQYELDRRERDDAVAMSEIREVLANVTPAADVGFIERETLGRWIEVVREITAHPPTWDRLPRTLGRHLVEAGYGEAEIAALYEDVPAILRETLDHVTEPRVREFLDQTIDRSLERLREYLA